MKKLLFILVALGSLLSFSCGNKANVVKMGTNAAFPPFEWVEGKEVVGFDVTLSNLIANDYGKTLKVVDMSFDGLIAALQAGSVDFIASGMTATEERRKSVDFSDPYYSSKQTIIVRVSNKSVSSVADLKGMSIGVQAATTGEIYATEEIEGASVKSFRTVIDAALALKNSAIEAIIIDELPAKEIVKVNPELKIVDDDFFTDEYAIAVKKGNTELLNSINNTIRTIKANGIYQKMLEAYMPLDGDVKIVTPEEL
ncbi:MAG: basic amino acid ABC transporter substrate-binding protein [Treponema sp.]|nr:basic amino acid ABC transporter substrate-binding protein [Treponema sp.]MEE3436306.1 basic amino acid ABC transporter substrate-binding protein [Treponema sp.]